ncbi:MAG TPA: biotin/lipoyl-binding protein, partial [bacterium]|nr:biotin/lipoyl-binding protein [bacterium]
MIGRRVGVALLLPVVLTAGLAGACNRNKEPKYKQSDYAEVTRGDLALVVKATGTIEPKEITRLKSEASGKILQLNVKEGHVVQAGQTIAVLDQWRQELARDRAALGVQQSQHALAELERGSAVSAIRNAEVAVRNAEIELDNARTNQRRTGELYSQGFASAREMEEADRAVERAQVALEAAQRDLQQVKTQGNPDAIRSARLALQQSRVALAEAQREVGNAHLVSPIAGTILEKFVSEGDTVIGTN